MRENLFTDTAEHLRREVQTDSGFAEKERFVTKGFFKCKIDFITSDFGKDEISKVDEQASIKIFTNYDGAKVGDLIKRNDEKYRVYAVDNTFKKHHIEIYAKQIKY